MLTDRPILRFRVLPPSGLEFEDGEIPFDQHERRVRGQSRGTTDFAFCKACSVQRATCKPWTASCMLVTAPRDQTGPVRFPRNAGLAQLAEHRSCKADVAGSIPAPGSVPTRADFLLGCAEEEQAPVGPPPPSGVPTPRRP